MGLGGGGRKARDGAAGRDARAPLRGWEVVENGFLAVLLSSPFHGVSRLPYLGRQVSESGAPHQSNRRCPSNRIVNYAE